MAFAEQFNYLGTRHVMVSPWMIDVVQFDHESADQPGRYKNAGSNASEGFEGTARKIRPVRRVYKDIFKTDRISGGSALPEFAANGSVGGLQA